MVMCNDAATIGLESRGGSMARHDVARDTSGDIHAKGKKTPLG